MKKFTEFLDEAKSTDNPVHHRREMEKHQNKVYDHRDKIESDLHAKGVKRGGGPTRPGEAYKKAFEAHPLHKKMKHHEAMVKHHHEWLAKDHADAERKEAGVQRWERSSW